MNSNILYKIKHSIKRGQMQYIFHQIFVLERKLYVFLIIFSLISCESRHEEIVNDVNDLLEKEKYQTAYDHLQKEMKKKRPGDRSLSDNAPLHRRILLISGDKKKVVWVEDETILAWDRELDKIDETGIENYPETFSISDNAKYALLTMPLKKNQGCRMLAISLFDDTLKYESGAHVSCKNSGSIANDGGMIYYFIDEHVYAEKTSEPKNPVQIIHKSKLSPPFEKLKNRMVMVPAGNNYLIFYGIGGSYNLYFFAIHSNNENVSDAKSSVKKIAEEIMSPEVYQAYDQSGYVIGGTIGKMNLKKVDYAKGSVSTGIAIGNNEYPSWPTNHKDEFISGGSTGVYLWQKGNKPQLCPVIYEKFWGLDDRLIYENEKKKLFLSDINFTEEEWNLVALLKQVKAKL